MEVLIDGRPVAAGAVVPVSDGQVVAVGRVQGGLRAYLSVSGGFDTKWWSVPGRPTCSRELGPGPLVAGDRLDLGVPGRPHGQLLTAPGDPTSREAARDEKPDDPGGRRDPTRCPPPATGLLAAGPWTVGPASNRIGVAPHPADRPALGIPGREGRIRSTGMVSGAIQLPPDGRTRSSCSPTTPPWAGYPVVACVISADLPLVGQLEPGETVEFVAVDRPRARDLWPLRTGAGGPGDRMVPDRGRDLNLGLRMAASSQVRVPRAAAWRSGS